MTTITSLESINWEIKPSEFKLTVPGISELQKEMTGTLQMSSNGYVFSVPKKSVTWFKFLGLATYLPIYALIAKSYQLACQCFGSPIPNKGYQDIKHAFHLASIAWKAVIGWEKHSLLDRVEQFALAEIDYNNANRYAELDKKRSDRLLTGFYTAKCMQPEFHKSQYTPPSPLRKRIDELNKKKEELDTALKNILTPHPKGWSLLPAIQDYLANNPYSKWETNQIIDQQEHTESLLSTLNKQLQTTERCEKYATRAILNQQCCPHAIKKASDAIIQTEADVKCCGSTCYKQQRICGVLVKIDCCATRFWALDCFCCVCCFWPDARRCGVI